MLQKLSTYIEYTLMTRHYVFVPGIGGFLLRDVDATYKNKVYTPSHREIHFNRFLTNDDGMLADAYMRTEGLSYDQAISQIRLEVANIKTTLDRTNSFQLGRLGVLTYDSDHHLIIKNPKHFMLDPECYGLGSLSIRPWKEIEKEQQKAKVEVTKRIEPAHNDDVISIPKYWVRRAVACAVIVLCLFANFNSSNKTLHIDHAAMFDTNILFGTDSPKTITEDSWDASWETEAALAEVESMLAETTNDVFSEIIEEEATEAEEFVKEEENIATEVEIPEPKIEKTNTIGKQYYVIIASCTTRDEAERLVKRRQSEGYSNIGILERDGRFRLYMQSFTVRSEGESFLHEVRTTTPFQTAWLLPVSPV